MLAVDEATHTHAHTHAIVRWSDVPSEAAKAVAGEAKAEAGKEAAAAEKVRLLRFTAVTAINYCNVSPIGLFFLSLINSCFFFLAILSDALLSLALGKKMKK